MVNQKAVDLSGFSKQELLNQLTTGFIHPDDLDSILDRHQVRLKSEGIPSGQEFRLLHKNGTVRWVELNLVPISWDGQPATLAFITDITDHKLAERALRESEERYRLFFKTTLDAVFMTTPDGRYIDFNDTLIEYLGATSRQEVLATNVVNVYAHPDDRTAILERVRRDEMVKEHPVRLRRLNGMIIDALMTIVAQKNPDGSVKAYVGTVRDLSGHRDVLPSRSPLS